MQSIPLIPDVYAQFKNPVDVQHLFDLHCRTKKYVIRGLAAPRNFPFLSVLLFDDVQHERPPILMAIYFVKGTINVHPSLAPHFGVEELNMLLRLKQIRFSEGPLSETLWTLGRNRCCAHVLRRKLIHWENIIMNLKWWTRIVGGCAGFGVFVLLTSLIHLSFGESY